MQRINRENIMHSSPLYMLAYLMTQLHAQIDTYRGYMVSHVLSDRKCFTFTLVLLQMIVHVAVRGT